MAKFHQRWLMFRIRPLVRRLCASKSWEGFEARAGGRGRSANDVVSALQLFRATEANVRFGSKAALTAPKFDFRFSAES
jgi:hypothetical protein